jgi:hypothetical protein
MFDGQGVYTFTNGITQRGQFKQGNPFDVEEIIPTPSSPVPTTTPTSSSTPSPSTSTSSREARREKRLTMSAMKMDKYDASIFEASSLVDGMSNNNNKSNNGGSFNKDLDNKNLSNMIDDLLADLNNWKS